MKTVKHTLLMSLLVLATACSSSTANEDNQLNPANGASANDESVNTSETFSIEGKAACEVVSLEAVAAFFDVPASDISSESYRDKDDHKLCRYEIRYSQDKIASLFINIQYNDRQDVVPNQFSDEFKKALSDGIPVAGFKDKIQTFESVQNLADQAAYSGNLPDNKNLILRINEDYFIRLEYSRYDDGKDIGDYKQELIALAKALLQ